MLQKKDRTYNAVLTFCYIVCFLTILIYRLMKVMHNITKDKENKDKKDGISLDIKLNVNDIWLFSMYNANRGMLGIFNLSFTLAAIYMLMINISSSDIPMKLLFVFFILLFSVIQPAMLYLKAFKQAKNNHIKDGFKIIIYKSAATNTMIIIFLNNIRAYLIPKRYLNKDNYRLKELIKSKTRVSFFTRFTNGFK